MIDSRLGIAVVVVARAKWKIAHGERKSDLRDRRNTWENEGGQFLTPEWPLALLIMNEIWLLSQLRRVATFQLQIRMFHPF